MQLQILRFLLNIQLLLIVFRYVRSTPVFQSSSMTMEFVNRTKPTQFQQTVPTCQSNRECNKHGWCKDGDCQCEKGWITRWSRRQCSYKQCSKLMAFILSFVAGSAGIDWFVLSRKDSLYILCGVLKLLISTGCCIWSPLAARSQNKNATTAASCLSVSLTLIAFIWWLIDWIRILFNSFPDGNGVSLIWLHYYLLTKAIMEYSSHLSFSIRCVILSKLYFEIILLTSLPK